MTQRIVFQHAPFNGTKKAMKSGEGGVSLFVSYEICR